MEREVSKLQRRTTGDILKYYHIIAQSRLYDSLRLAGKSEHNLWPSMLYGVNETRDNAIASSRSTLVQSIDLGSTRYLRRLNEHHTSLALARLRVSDCKSFEPGRFLYEIALETGYC